MDKKSCPICRNHKGGKPLMIRDDNGQKHPYTHICNCPYCGRFLSENYETAPVAGEEKPVIGTCSEAEFHRHILRGLLHYHERMMLMYEQCPGGGCDCADKSGVDKGKCIRTLLGDPYAEALKEAIRCVEIVHGNSSCASTR